MPRSTINGTAIDLDGKEMILDADQDTTLTVDTDDRVDIRIAGTDTVHIDASGIGVNINNPLYPLHVTEASGGDTAAIFIDGPTDGTSALFMGDSDDIDIGAIQYNHSSNYMFFRTNAAEAMRIDSNGHLILKKNLALDMTTSEGIDFGAAGSSANTLDDYEEGTHQTAVSMATSGTVTLNTSFDRFSYTKVGRLVTITGNPRIASVSSPVGSMSMTLPFTAASGQTDECRSGGMIRYYDNSAGSGAYNKPMGWSISEGTSTLLISNTSTHNNNVTPAASDEFYFCVSYITAT